MFSEKSRIRRTSETSYRPRATFVLDDSHIRGDNSAPSEWLAVCMLLGTRARGKRGGGGANQPSFRWLTALLLRF